MRSLSQLASPCSFTGTTTTSNQHFHSPYTASQNIEMITELATVPTPAVVESMAEITNATSWSYQGSSNFVPKPLSTLLPISSILNSTLPSNPISSADGLILEGTVPSVQGHYYINRTGFFNQLSHLQSENLLGLQHFHFHEQPNPCNQLLIPNIMENNSFNGININQPSPCPALIHPNPVQVRSGNTDASSGPVFAPPQRHSLPLHNDISNSHAARSSRLPQPFTTVHNQVGHASELQHILDLHYQDSRRSEPYSNLQPGLATMPPNPFQQRYRPVLSDPADPSASLVGNYAQHSTLSGTSRNSFGSGSSVPPRTQPSEAIRRILNMNPTRMVTRNTPCIVTEQIQSKCTPVKRVRYEPPHRGRPPKRRDAEGSSSQRGKSLRLSNITGKRGGSSATSQRAQRTTGSLVILPNPPRLQENAVYDMEFEGKVIPLSRISDYSNQFQGN